MHDVRQQSQLSVSMVDPKRRADIGRDRVLCWPQLLSTISGAFFNWICIPYRQIFVRFPFHLRVRENIYCGLSTPRGPRSASEPSTPRCVWLADRVDAERQQLNYREWNENTINNRKVKRNENENRRIVPSREIECIVSREIECRCRGKQKWLSNKLRCCCWCCWCCFYHHQPWLYETYEFTYASFPRFTIKKCSETLIKNYKRWMSKTQTNGRDESSSHMLHTQNYASINCNDTRTSASQFRALTAIDAALINWRNISY